MGQRTQTRGETGGFDARGWLQGWLGEDALWVEVSSAPTLVAHTARSLLGARVFVLEPRGPVNAMYTEWDRAPSAHALEHLLQRMAAEAPGAMAYLVGWCRHASEVVVGTAIQGDGSGRVWRGTPRDLQPDQSTLLASPPTWTDVSRETPAGRIRAAAMNAWTVLGRSDLTRRFLREVGGHLREIEKSMTWSEGGQGEAHGHCRRQGEDEPGRSDDGLRHRHALELVSRLLLLLFLQERGALGEHPELLRSWLLESGVDQLWRRRWVPLCRALAGLGDDRPARLATLPVLGGALFDPGTLVDVPVDVPDEPLRRLFLDLLGRYRFTAREAGDGRCIDPEMLGQVFEAWMERPDRSRDGAFYTPPGLVDQLVVEALARHLRLPGAEPSVEGLRAWLAATPDALREVIGRENAAWLARRILALRIVDPACGSGAFLVSAAAWCGRLLWLAAQAAGDALDDGEPTPRSEAHAISMVLRDVVHGVDRSATASTLCTLRLWLLLVSRTGPGERLPGLPNLDHRIRQGNALWSPAAAAAAEHVPLPDALVAQWKDVQRRWGLARGEARTRIVAERRALARALHDHRWSALLRRDRARLDQLRRSAECPGLFGEHPGPSAGVRHRIAAIETAIEEAEHRRHCWSDERDLPFDAAVDFADVLASGGFDLVLGNPPWVRLSAIEPHERALVLDLYPWMRGRDESGRPAGRPGNRSAFGVQADLSVAFVQRALQWLRPGGTLAYVIPAKLLRAPYGAALREGLVRRTDLVQIEDLSRTGQGLFHASVYPAILMADRRRPRARVNEPAVKRTVRLHGLRAPARLVHPEDLGLDGAPSDPWPLLGRQEMQALRALQAAAPPLSRSLPVRMGIKTGANALFLDPAPPLSECRPVLRGRDRDGVPASRLLFAHDPVTGDPLALPSAEAMAWLEPHAARLRRRADSRPDTPIWSVFRVSPELLGHRVVWADIGPTLCPHVLEPVRAGGPLVLNTLYGVGAPDPRRARRWAAWLASAPIQLLLQARAEPALGGHFRFQAHAVGSVPFPPVLLGDDVRTPSWVISLDQAVDDGAPGAAIDAIVLDALALAAAPHRLLVHLGERRAGERIGWP